MIDDAEPDTSCRHSTPSVAEPESGAPFRHLNGRGYRWSMAGVYSMLLALPVMVCLPDWVRKTTLATGFEAGFFVLCFAMALYTVMVPYGAYLSKKERAALIEDTLDAPETADLLTYILAFAYDGANVHAQAAQGIAKLLPELSGDELACLKEEYWRRLCPPLRIHPRNTGEDRDDPLHTAVFSAIMRMKRLESLPYIESRMQHLDAARHSDAYIRTLRECYGTLLKHQEGLDPSVILLRASSAAATPEALLRPASGTHLAVTETGEQLLRVSMEEELGVSIRKVTSSSGEAMEHVRGNQVDG